MAFNRTGIRNPRNTRTNDEDWYIPYTGPYEQPPSSTYPTNKDRDSWGDPISVSGLVDNGNGENGVGEDPNSHVHPHVHYDGSGDQHQHVNGFNRSSEDSRGRDRGRGRDRSYSLASTFTTSTTTGIEQHRISYNNTSFSRPPIPSYVTPPSDFTGGVGESPAPFSRTVAKDRPLSRRTSLASLFGAFGIKSPQKRLGGHVADKASTHPHTRTLSIESYNNTTSNNQAHSPSIRGRRGIKEPIQSINSQVTEEDYYNSYYSTLIQSPISPHHNHNIFSSLLRQDSVTSTPAAKSNKHPYAISFPKSEDVEESGPEPGPATAIPKLTFTGAGARDFDSDNTFALQNRLQPSTRDQQKAVRRLSGYSSTPNFMTHSHFSANTKPPAQVQVQVPPLAPLASPRKGKGKEKWLSAETWCDALLFPRPRLKLKNDGESGESGSGRIVSPPGSPILSQVMEGRNQTQGFASRVLAHSRSLVDLKDSKLITTANGFQSQLEKSDVGISLTTTTTTPPQKSRGKGKEREREGEVEYLRPPRPKSWASDDLDLPSPVPSLAKVLEEAERLAHERREWKDQAFNSLGNKRARSVSRARSKSLTAKGRKNGNGNVLESQTNVEFLAARACLGDQKLIDVGTSGRSSKQSKSSSRSRSGQESSKHTRDTSHTNTTSTNSIMRTLTRSSKSHSRQHSRNDSWSKTAFKSVKSTASNAVGACLQNDNTVTPVDEKPHPTQFHQDTPHRLEDALQRTDTKIIHLNDPSHVLPSDMLSPIAISASTSASRSGIGGGIGNSGGGISPVSPALSRESILSDSRIGIALSTPPPLHLHPHLEHSTRDMNTNVADEREISWVSSHPYAQASSSNNRPAEIMYAGPHPSSPAYISSRMADVQSPIGRHRFPPQPQPQPQPQPSSHSHSHSSQHPLTQIQHQPPPPQSTINHPYAQVLSSDMDTYNQDIDDDESEKVFIKQIRPDSDVSPSSKMWAPTVKPGVVREVLPVEIKYSPYIDGEVLGSGTLVGGRGGRGEVGIGEVLAYADEFTRRRQQQQQHQQQQQQQQYVECRQSPDSGIGTSENVHGSIGGGGYADDVDQVQLGFERDQDQDRFEREDERESVEEEEEVEKLNARYTTQHYTPSSSLKPSGSTQRRTQVKYEVTRPLLQKALRSSETAHTYASSPLEHHLTPKLPFVSSSGGGGRFGSVNNYNSASASASVSNWALGEGEGDGLKSGEVSVSRASPVNIASEGSSQSNSPRPLGSPNDLVGFQDLFYKPSAMSDQNQRQVSGYGTGTGTGTGTGLRLRGNLQRHGTFGEGYGVGYGLSGSGNVNVNMNASGSGSGNGLIGNGNANANGSQIKLSSIPYDLKSSPVSTYSTPSSGLTNLARKLSEEYDVQVERERERERSGSQYSFQSTLTSGTGVTMSSMSRLPRSYLGRRPTDESLEFVFEEMQRTSSPDRESMMESGGSGSRDRVIDSFHPGKNIPEDVVEASSSDNHGTVEEEEDETAVFQMKRVEAATPTAVTSDRRLSFTGQVYEAHDHHPHHHHLHHLHPERLHYSGSGSDSRSTPNVINNIANMDALDAQLQLGEKEQLQLQHQHISIISSPPSPTSPSEHARIVSGLQAPLSLSDRELDIGRSSYITSSTFSRMSTLSDFPVPPKDYIENHRMSLLSAYFDERMRRRGGDSGIGEGHGVGIGIGEGEGEGEGEGGDYRNQLLGTSPPDMISMRTQRREEERQNEIVSPSPANSYNLSMVHRVKREDESDVDASEDEDHKQERDEREEDNEEGEEGEDNEDTFRQRLSHHRRLTFGEGVDAEDLVQALSDHGHGHAI